MQLLAERRQCSCLVPAVAAAAARGARVRGNSGWRPAYRETFSHYWVMSPTPPSLARSPGGSTGPDGDWCVGLFNDDGELVRSRSPGGGRADYTKGRRWGGRHVFLRVSAGDSFIRHSPSTASLHQPSRHRRVGRHSRSQPAGSDNPVMPTRYLISGLMMIQSQLNFGVVESRE